MWLGLVFHEAELDVEKGQRNILWIAQVSRFDIRPGVKLVMDSQLICVLRRLSALEDRLSKQI